MEKILVAVRKISDLKDGAEVEYFFECIDCGTHLFYNKVPRNDEEGWTFNCANCGKTYTSL